MRRTLALVLVALTLAACQSPEASDQPTATAASGYSDAQQAAILTDSIDVVYCGDAPMPDWCSVYGSVQVEDQWAYIASSLTAADMALAETMCSDIAAATYDENAEPIGVTDVLIFGSGGADLTDCDVPTH